MLVSLGKRQQKAAFQRLKKDAESRDPKEKRYLRG
jgi:hypothetical protein